jgi:integrase
MAQIVQRVWKSGPRKVKRSSWGYTAMIDGRQVRRSDAGWTEDDARAALVAAQRGDTGVATASTDRPQIASTALPASGLTLDEARARFLATKTAEGKRTVRDDRLNLARLVVWFGAATPLSDITAAKIAEYRIIRAQHASQRRLGQTVSAATVNHELRVLRHLLRLASEEWQVLDRAPRVRLLREPQGRLRWLEPAEEARLLTACLACGGEALRDMVLVALETGMRQGEILALTWERTDFARGVFKLEQTKSGRRREVPMRQLLYDRLSTMPGPREGRLWTRAFPRGSWEMAVQEAKLEDFHFHDCRHHFASWFMMRGGSLQELKEILGHADITMTLRYAHLSPAHLRSAMLKTEREAVPAASTQDSAQEAVTLVEVSSK